MTSSAEQTVEEPISKLQAAESSVFASRWEQFTPYIAEFWGTLVITATFLCNVDGAGTDPAFKSISQAFMVIGIVSATKHITGASLNPSVSLALALAGRQKLRTAGLLCIAQIAGGLTAATLCHEAGVAKELVLGPHKFHNWFQVGLLETLYACMLCLVYLNCAASTKNNPKGDGNGFIGLAVGCCYLAGHNAAEKVCSSVSNSAVAIGLIVYGASVGSGGIHISHGVGYFMYDLLGAFLAAGIYRVLRPKEFYSLSILLEDNNQESAVLGSEFIGTFYIVLTQVSCTLSGGMDLGPQAWGTAAAVIAMVCALRDVSGAHFNPAVTLAVRCSGRAPAEDEASDSSEVRYGIFYALAQVLAGVVAAMVAGIVHASRPRTGTDEAATAGQICVAEVFGAFFLCYVVLASSVTFPVEGSRSKQNNLAGLAYGSVILATTLTVGNISGAMLNPVSVVSAIMTGAVSGRNSLLVDAMYHVVAAVAAAASFLVTHAQLYAKDALEADERLTGL